MIFKNCRIDLFSELYRRYVNNFDEVSSFFNINPFNLNDYSDILEIIEKRRYERKRLVELLVSQNVSFGNCEKTIDSIKSLEQEDSYVVFSGQQVGIFGGPLYTVYKALTSIALARQLESRYKRKFLPLFWALGDDHDFDEVRSVKIRNKEGRPEILTYDPETAFQGGYAGKVNIDADFDVILSELESSINASEYKNEIFEAMRRCYRNGRNLEEAFCCWLAGLAGESGLIVVNASNPEIKKLAIPLFLKDVEYSDGQISRIFNRTDKRLLDDNLHCQTKRNDNQLDMFYCGRRREKITKSDGCFEMANEGIILKKSELAELIENEPDRFSPSVILRPIMQDYIFPTVANVAGPAEIAYFAQMKGLYELFDVPMPAVFPRKSITILEKSSVKIMKKYDISFTDIIESPFKVKGKIAENFIPTALEDKITELEEVLDSKLETIEVSAEAIDRNLVSSVKTVKYKINKEIAHLRNKVKSETVKKNQVIAHQAEKLLWDLYPEGILQERYYNIIEYIAKYSKGFLRDILDGISENPGPEHMLAEV